jgi:4-hydroxybenzoate polyprenyltransferase
MAGTSRPTSSVPRMLANTVRALTQSLREARPVVQAIFLLRFLAAAALAVLSGAQPRLAIAWGAAAWFLVTWAVYLINGVADVTEDRANGSTRPIASGELCPETAVRIAWFLGGAGLLLAAAVSPWLALLAGGQLALGWAYSMGPVPLKRVTLHAATSVVLAGLLTYIAGAVCAGGAAHHTQLWVFPVLMALWMAVGGITKDLSDVRGDRLAGRRTLPIVLGERRARNTMAVVASAIGVAFAISAWDAPLAVRVASWIVVFGAAGLTWVVCGAASRGGASRRRRPYKIFMATQYLAHLTVVASVAAV